VVSSGVNTSITATIRQPNFDLEPSTQLRDSTRG